MRDIIRILPLLAAAIGLGGCIEEAELGIEKIEVKGADGGVNLKVEPLREQGYRLSARVEHLSGRLDGAGFHIEQSDGSSRHHLIRRVPVSDLSDFTTIVASDQFYARKVLAYAYVICDSIEVHSQPLELTLATNVLPDPQPVVDRVEISEPWYSGQYWNPRYYTVSLLGQGFVPFDGFDTHNPFFDTHYLRCESTAEAKPLPVTASPTQLTVRLTLHRYNYPERLVWWQGTSCVEANDLRVEAPNWLLPPSRTYRLGETFVPEFATEVGRDKITLVDEVNYLSYGTSFVVSPADLRSQTFVQYYDHIPIHDRPLVIPVSYPWQRVEGREGYSRIERERVCSGHRVFKFMYYGALGWFDGETLSEQAVSMPYDSWSCQIAASDDPQSIVVVNVGNMNDRHDIYRLDIASQKWTKLGSAPHEHRYIYLAYERGGVLFEVWSSASGWQLVKIDLSTLQSSSEPLDLGIDAIDCFAGEYNGRIYYSRGRRLYAYDLALRQHQSLPDLQGYNTWGDYYTTISGHWLYNGDAPTIRYDLDQPSPQPEFLGCPERGFNTSWSYPMGDDCYMGMLEYEGLTEVHRLYRFVEDR